MPALSSIPDRPLTTAEVAALNDADAFDLAVPVEREEAVRAEDNEPVVVTESLVLAAADWVKGVIHEEDGWRVVENVTVEGEDRTEAMLTCEAAVEDALKPGVRADADG
ncbi:hypothetical protein MBEHAL_1638 [Halarchaeum acidiphilum MH1-52-1]|uniref:DUF7964 domain-containing protein n=1 Tax=Halarchaeum acidiphilum MH1-52-1 TaxID=1261545 RepID=U3ADP1_9EURY|nr:hypothetical protein [Halarchaeum acidiphilum]GAD52878.1 hypothetical protein MBEHAL_1638 [Halarchaeum acidiphilum MH1-52-1]